MTQKSPEHPTPNVEEFKHVPPGLVVTLQTLAGNLTEKRNKTTEPFTTPRPGSVPPLRTTTRR